jgi:cell division protease FtsH
VLYFGKISTGASDDLNKAYQIAKTIITQYGFGDKIGWVQYDETEYAKEYSKDT